ncbi:MAG: ABC transporter ATP-binding protein [Planctomycetota bacterium]
MTPPAGHGSRDQDSTARRLPRGYLLAQIWRFVRPHQRLLWFGLALLFLNVGARLGQPWLMKTAIDDFLLDEEQTGFVWLLVGYLGLAVVEWLGRRGQLLALERAGQSTLLDLRIEVFRHLQRLPMRFFDRTPVGRLVGRATTDIEALQELFSSGLVTVLGDIVFLAVAVGILVSLDLELALASLASVPVFLAATIFVRRFARKAYTELRTRLSQMNADLHEQVSGMEVVQLFGQEEQSAHRFSDSNQGLRSAQLRSVRWESVLSALTEMIASITTAVVLWVGGRSVLGLDGDEVLSIGTLYAFVDYMRQMFVPLTDLSLRYTVFQNGMIAGDRIFGLLKEEPESPDPAEPAVSEGAGVVEFDAVGFGYDPSRPVLSGFNLRVAPGERVALVGATGAGKSTVLNLLTRLYEIDSGAIRLDGADIREMARQDLRRRVGVVTQDVFLFSGSILDNIRLARPDTSDEEAIRAAEELGLGEIVKRFPNGYYEPVAERGRNLSAGERQLIAFARVLVAQPDVIALDEATSNVDAETESILQRALHRVMANRTSLVIAHRLATVREADRIVVIGGGEVLETGRHEDLVQAGGAYAELDRLR